MTTNPQKIYDEYLAWDINKDPEVGDYGKLMSLLDELVYSCREENNLKNVLNSSPINEYIIMLYENRDYNINIKACALRYLTPYHREYSELPCYELLLNDLIWLFGKYGEDYRGDLIGLIKPMNSKRGK